MAARELWCRVTVLGPGGSEQVRCTLEGPRPPDLGVVDGVARLALLAARHGGAVVLSEVASDLRELLDLAGLGVEVQGEPEGGKEPFGAEEVEEERHLGDPSL
jgi:hypothetical protein